MNATITKVSIVEDTENIRKRVVQRIERTDGLELVSEYSNGEDAVKGLVSDKPDLVLMDIGLPYMDGIECMLRTKARAPSIAFLMFTVFQQDEKVFESLKAGAIGYILKSDGAAGVVDAILEFRNGGAPMSQDIALKILLSFHKQTRDNSLLESLNPRQMQILKLLSEGYLYKEICTKLTPQITEGGLKQNIHRIYKKLQVNNRTEAMLKYFNFTHSACPNPQCPIGFGKADSKAK